MRCKVVVIVEDEPAMRKALSRLLNANGFATLAFASAEAFLHSDAAAKASCLVLDIHLGGMSGIDLCRRLKAVAPQLPVIFITALDDEATHSEAMDAGCVAYLRKPCPAGQLMDAIVKARTTAPKPDPNRHCT
jgi:FixJ family two-component response regulator